MNILVIEDDSITASLISALVEPLGPVKVSHSIEAAMQEIKEAPEGSLMLWDLRFPDSTAENTASVIRKVREKDPMAKMVIVSGMPVIPETGADAVVKKGASMNFSAELYAAIFRALTGKPGYEQTVNLIQRISEEKGLSLDTPPHPA